jgi:hypothetical protein
MRQRTAGVDRAIAGAATTLPAAVAVAAQADLRNDRLFIVACPAGTGMPTRRLPAGACMPVHDMPQIHPRKRAGSGLHRV